MTAQWSRAGESADGCCRPELPQVRRDSGQPMPISPSCGHQRAGAASAPRRGGARGRACGRTTDPFVSALSVPLPSIISFPFQGMSSSDDDFATARSRAQEEGGEDDDGEGASEGFLSARSHTQASAPRTASATVATSRSEDGFLSARSNPVSDAKVLADIGDSRDGDARQALGEDEVREEQRAFLFRCARHGRVEELQRTLSAMDPRNEPRDEHGNTLLIVGAQNGNKRVVRAALRWGAGVNACNDRGNTALHYAVAFGFEELVEYLLCKGADDTLVNAQGRSCFQGIVGS